MWEIKIGVKLKLCSVCYNKKTIIIKCNKKLECGAYPSLVSNEFLWTAVKSFYSRNTYWSFLTAQPQKGVKRWDLLIWEFPKPKKIKDVCLGGVSGLISTVHDSLMSGLKSSWHTVLSQTPVGNHSRWV